MDAREEQECQRRVLFIAPALPPARIPEADHVLHECLHLSEMGFDVHVLTQAGADELQFDSITVHAVMPDWSWRQLPKFIRAVRRVRPQYTVLYFLGTLYSYSTMVLFFPLVVRALQPGSRFITQFSNLGKGAPTDGTFRSALKRLIFRVLGPLRLGTVLPLSHHSILLSEHQLHTLESYPFSKSIARRAVLIPPPPLLPIAPDWEAAREVGRKRIGVNKSEIVVAFFGRIASGKGIEELVNAVRSLRVQGYALQCLLIGGFMSTSYFYWNFHDDYQGELNDFLASSDAKDFTSLTGEYAWDSTEASEYLLASDIIVLPLGGGIRLNNSSFSAAVAHHQPVIATVGIPKESALQHKQNIYILDAPSSAEIAEAIEHVIAEPQLRAELVRGAAQLAERYFNWDSSTERLAAALTGNLDTGGR